MNIVSARLLSQHLSSPKFSLPEEVVSHFGAMQAQEYRMMRWAVGMRTRRPSAEAFRKAYDSGKIIRLHLLRGTWQLVSAEDYRWMLDLCSPGGFSVTMGWMHAAGYRITEEEIGRTREILCMTAASLRSATKQDFATALSEKGIVMEDHRLSFHIRLAELSGTLCSGDLHLSKATYSLTDEKVPFRPPMDRDASLMMLSEKYFRSHSPSTLEDFVWWSGLTKGDCRRGIELSGGDIVPLKLKNRTFYVHRDARVAGFRRGIILLPPYDEYLIGYKSRDLVLPTDHVHRAHNNSGIFYPVILRDGVAVGNWNPFGKSFSPTPFNEDDSLEGASEKWDRYQQFLKK